MKNSILLTVLSFVMFIAASIVSTSNSQAMTVPEDKTPGAIAIHVPPACDCTAPAKTCYCITD